MNYCEKCNCVVEGEYCQVCGTNKIRALKDDDFCYFNTVSAMQCEMFESSLKDHQITAVYVPYYTRNVTHFNAGRADSRRIYVRYSDFVKATEIYKSLFG